jgi:hypothetical protein
MIFLSTHKTTLLKEILSASSQEDVRRLIKEAIELLEKDKIDSQAICQLINKIIEELSLLSPLEKNAQQCNNIKTAKNQFFRIQKSEAYHLNN